MEDKHLFKWSRYKGAGKGDIERPLDKKRFEKNFDQIKWSGKVSGKAKKTRSGRQSWSY